jgi:DNA repair exonuclease SbcCD ATPase subunit
MTADGKHKVERNEKGHVKLPSPPGTVEEVDTLDTEIKGLQSKLKQQQQNTDAANTHSQSAKTQSQQLGQVGQGADARTADLDKGKSTHQKVAQDNTDAKTKAAQNNTQADQNLKKAADALRPIAPPIRGLNSGVQKLPSNRFFNVSGTKKNFKDITQAINDVTSAGAQQKTAQEQAKMCIDTRDQQIKTASTQRDTNKTAITDFKAQVKADQDKTTQVAADSKQQAKKSKQAELTLEQQIQQKKQDKTQKWSRLVGWAQQHNGLRRAAG